MKTTLHYRNIWENTNFKSNKHRKLHGITYANELPSPQ